MINETDVAQVTITGYGKFTVTRAVAKALAATAEAAQELTGLLYPESELAVPLYLTDIGPRKIAIIKEIRSLTGKNLKEAKQISDQVGSREGRHNNPTTGKVLLGVFSYARAQQVAEKFREAGGTVEFPSPLEMLAGEAE